MGISYLLMVVLFFFNAYGVVGLCYDSREPHHPEWPLTFCSNELYGIKGCCSANQDKTLQNVFNSLEIHDSNCAQLVKQVICAECDQFSSLLFQPTNKKDLAIPVLCNSTNLAANYSTDSNINTSYCSQVWGACKNVTIQNSPFLPIEKNGTNKLATNTTCKLNDFWSTEKAFCSTYGGSINDGVACFNGSATVLNITHDEAPIDGICLERISKSSFLNMIPHPDGSNRVFLASQKGQVWLATLPDENSGKKLEFNSSKPFLDLSDQIVSDGENGLLGIAFHPNFTKNGRFYLSFTCHKLEYPNCEGRCACNSDVGCDPSYLVSEFRTTPCHDFSVISEFTVNSTEPSKAKSANPTEIRRIFTMGLPFSNHHGGQILFGPHDGYLYFMMGDGGNTGDPYNFAQNSRSLLGKIMRFDVDGPLSEVQNEFNLWGNYSIPKDNPFAGDTNWQPEVWALGFRNPWRCSFDFDNPAYFLCGDVGQDTYEEVNLVTKGGNYGWRVYEGQDLYSPPLAIGGTTNLSSINPIFPVTGYYHNITNAGWSSSIIGGYVSRSDKDPCLYGRYLYADLFGSHLWVGTETPVKSGNFSSKEVIFRCSSKSPIPCSYSNHKKYPDLTYIWSFSQDNRNDLYLLTDNGIYSVVRPSKCDFKCSKDKFLTAPRPSRSPSPLPLPPVSSSAISSIQVWLPIFLILLHLCHQSTL